MDIPMKDKNEIKIFILYLMDRIGYPVKFTDICSILYQENVVSYFDSGDCFTELIDARHVIEVEKDESGDALYQVSATGRTIATELNDAILPSIKEMSYRSAIRHLSFQKRGAALNCSMKPSTEEGKYMVHCEITERGRIVLDINIEVDSKIEGERMLINFRRKPEIVFRGTLALVSGEKNYIFE
ncbi:MAG: DUF4364 family protein [Clostridia bacterium]|nr:DUF4364 family protein [Clostridia bacterium]